MRRTWLHRSTPPRGPQAKRLVRKHFKLPSNAAFGVGQVFQLAVLVAGVTSHGSVYEVP